MVSVRVRPADSPEGGASRSRTCIRAAAAGFTLIEVLVAVTLLALISIALFAGLNMATTTWRRAAGPLEVELEEHAVMSLLRRQFAELHAVFAQIEGQELALFAGTPESVRFVSPLPSHRGVAGLYVIEFAVAPEGELEFGYVLYRPDRHVPLEEAEISRRETLLPGFGGALFSYLGPPADGAAPGWLESWQGVRAFPHAVRLVRPAANGPAEAWTFRIWSEDSRFRVRPAEAEAGGQSAGRQSAGAARTR